MTNFSHLTREELEERLSVSEEVCSAMAEHMKYAQLSLWRKMVASLRQWKKIKRRQEKYNI